MKRFILAILLLLCSCVSAIAAYPYDSICEVRVGRSGGSGTLIAVSETQALILSCQHVAETPGMSVQINWAATGETSDGKVLAIGANGLDIAIIICPRPTGLQPVPITLPSWASTKKIINAGFPGLTGTLEWQTGKVVAISTDELRYSCRPIPGMSGGATLDQHGNLVGVITRYGPRYGLSTSGTDMMSFVGRFMKNTTVKTWKSGIIDYSEEVPDGPEATTINAPENYYEFEQFIWEKYIQPFRESVEPKEPDAVEPEDATVSFPTTLEVPKAQVYRPTKKRRERTRRRIFRRR
jgi:hypothetical protein